MTRLRFIELNGNHLSGGHDELALLFAIFSMGVWQKKSAKEIGDSLNNGMSAVAGILLIVGGGGAWRGVLVTGGLSDKVASLFQANGHMSAITVIIFAWAVAAVLRISVGSATVAGMTVRLNRGILCCQSLQSQNNPTLAVLVALAIGAGSLIASHVNDAGFWIFQECLRLDFLIEQNFPNLDGFGNNHFVHLLVWLSS